ncbi:ribonuclease Z [Polycladomyces subterraneus]|uniref:Ribonuclease Z n=1 Tax=Polycladomyces subterraneus TaxID=1016997 RepID=A0ABT8ILY7_9BACL|nr:ribonuclease Z [Polycladomyces subterraneus]MDN4593740.1 ribonuclease Z [Polycladomyces subterraneus]
MELIFLGTGAGVPAKERNVSATALKWTERKGRTWLFDCGEATQHQILHSPVKLGKVDHIWITHLHGDHLFGLPGVLGSRSFQEANTPLILFGPEGLRRFVDTVLTVSQTHLRYEWEVREVTPGVVYEDDDVRVICAELDHGIPCFGYRIEEKDRPGSLRTDLLKALGVPPGPLYRRLKAGQDVQLPDGRMIRAREVLGPPKRGRVVTILGDTRPTEAAVRLASQADVLVHEATYRTQEAALAVTHGHATTVDAARTAVRAGVRTLILNHISPRYGVEDEPALLAEARAIFPETYVARDGWCFPVISRD